MRAAEWSVCVHHKDKSGLAAGLNLGMHMPGDMRSRIRFTSCFSTESHSISAASTVIESLLNLPSHRHIDLTRRSRAIITRHLTSRHDDAMLRLLPSGTPAWLRLGRPPSATPVIASCATLPEQSHVATRVAVVAAWRVAWDGTFGIQAFRFLPRRPTRLVGW
jgi:hypothetical protein